MSLRVIKPLLYKYFDRRVEKGYEKNIKGKIAQCNPCPPLSKEQIKETQDFWAPLLKRHVPVYWHQYFTARNGNFSPLYVPNSIYHTEIIYRLNFHPFRNAYVDKGTYDERFPDICRPRTIVKNINGYFYDAKDPISQEKALELCGNLTFAVIKPSQEGMWGEGVNVISTKEGNLTDGSMTVKQLFDKYGKNFIVQEKIEQHPGMAELNPDSVNTLRVLTYRRKDEVVVLYVVVRIGRKGKTVDNETAGGINADIDLTTGCIKDCAFGTPSEKKIYKTDIGTVLENHPIPSFDNVIETAKKMHFRLPYFNIIGWDFTVDKEGNPVLIEFNRCPDLSQTAHGPAFGEYTEEIVKRALASADTKQHFI